MKHFLKVFLITFSIIMAMAGVGAYTFSKFDTGEDQDVVKEVVKEEKNVEKEEKKEEKKLDPFEEAVANSSRINMVAIGMERQGRTDTIMFVSYDVKNGKVDLINIPRDTYYYEKGEDHAEQRKINAVYNRHGFDGVKNAVSDLLGVPVDHYVGVKYKGVEEIVDVIGGVEMYIPFHMKYDDPYDKPPLHINIPKGNRLLDGDEAIKFLRYRKGYPNGDLGRIEAQQKFIKSALKKSMSLNLPAVVRTAMDNIKTDVSSDEVIAYALAAASKKIDIENALNAETLPGEAHMKSYSGQRLSYFFPDEDEIESVVREMYGVKEVKVAENEEATSEEKKSEVKN